MKAFKNFIVGFAVSFIGSLPLGYLNMIGYQIYSASGIADVLWFLSGVAAVEVIVIYATLVFAQKLSKNKKLMRAIEIFSILFMFVLAYVFWQTASDKEVSQNNFFGLESYHPFVIGVALSCFNFLQIPFWTGWNLYLINGKFISIEVLHRFTFIAGTLVGTFCGMLAFILTLNFAAVNSGDFSPYIMKYIIPAVFAGIGFFQIWKYCKNHYLK